MGGAGDAGPEPWWEFETLGGARPLADVMDDFTAALLADPFLAPYFRGVPPERVRRHQEVLLRQLLGGPRVRDRIVLAAAHRPLRIPDAHYQMFVGHLVASVIAMGVPDDMVAAIGQAASDVQAEIVFGPRWDA